MKSKHLFFSILALLILVASPYSVPSTALALTHGTLIKASSDTVYYYHSDGKRYVFPDEKTYFSWYENFDSVITITDAELASIPVGGNVRYRPGYKMLKITSDPKVYAVGDNGELRWITSEAVARDIYGNDWAKKVNDLSDAFFVNYTLGPVVNSRADFKAESLMAKYQSISTLIAQTSYSGTSSNSQMTNGTSGGGGVSNIGSNSSNGSSGALSLDTSLITTTTSTLNNPVTNNTTTTTIDNNTNTNNTTDTTPSVVSPEISGKLLYVAPNGNDTTGDGTLSKPFKTITHALAIAESGTTIAIGPGIYQEGTIRITRPNITLTSSGPQKAVIQAPSTGDPPLNIRIDPEASGAVIKNLEIVGGYYGISLETMWDWGGADRSGVKNVLIEGNIVHDTGYDAIKIKPNVDNITIKNNEIYSTGRAANPESCNADGIDNVNGDNLLVEGNKIHNTCSNGIYCKGGAINCQIINNQFWETGGAGILIGFDTSPEYFDLTVNPNYYENINGVVKGNLIRNAKGAGIGLFASKNALVENNTVINAGKSYHAPLYYGVTFQDWDENAKRPANINPTIKNNIFVQQAGWPKLISQIRYSKELGGLSGLEGKANLSGNCYFAADGAGEYNDNRPNSMFNGVFADWIAHMTENGSFETDPKLDVNYHPTAMECLGRGY